jgi:hypothetical protein
MGTKTIVASGLAALYAAVGVVGSIVQTTFGIPGVAGAIMVMIGPFMVVFSLNLFSRFGGVLVMCAIYGVIALPFHVIGTPGFWPKILIVSLGGLVAELLFLLPLRRFALFNGFVGGIYEMVVGYLIVGLGLLFRLPEIEKLATIAIKWYAIIPSFLISSLFGLLGCLAFRRIERRPIIELAKKRMSGDNE